jgi:FKBP-type peptidyl-prolyl cis-trans isomerase FkpA
MRLFSALFVLALLVSGCSSEDGNNTPTSPSASVNVPYSTTDLRVGTGAEANIGRTVAVNYTGWLYSTSAAENKGTMFDTSIGRSPYVFTVGTGVIQGFSQGTVGMRVGGLRRVIIPPSLGYGSQGSGTAIPPNATLIFELELLAVQ